MALSSSIPSGSVPFTTLRRVPLAELPLRNYIERPPSPLKSYSSPGKIQPNILGTSPKPKSHSPSPSRSSSIHADLSSRHQLFREALRKGDSSNPSSAGTGTSGKSSPIEGAEGSKGASIASPKPVRVAAFALPLLSPSSSSQSLLQKSPLQASPTKKATTSAPQSLGKKKERIRRQLLDEDEEGGADIRAGSPSPSKMKAEREGALRGPSSSSSQLNKEQKRKEVMWSVWPDDEAENSTGPALTVEDDGEDEEQDKENVGPSNSSFTGRKKGTGGRLSLLATGDDTEADNTVDVHEKRRKVTPLAPAI